MTSPIEVRREITQALARGDARQVVRIVQDTAKRDRTPGCWRAIHRALRGKEGAIDGLFVELASLQIAIAASFTADNLAPYLDVVCLLAGINANIHVLPYNQFQMEFRNPTSKMHQFNPQVTVFLAELADLIGYVGPFEDKKAFDVAVKQAVRAVVDVATAFQSHAKGHLLVHNFVMPLSASDNPLGHPGLGSVSFYRTVNAALPGSVGEMPGVFVVDLDHLASRLGSETAVNRRMRYLARMPLSEALAQELAQVHAVHFRALCGKIRKCLVLDLDDVLWGGVVGEDGVTDVAIGDEPPGNVYRDIQRAVRRLYERGVILAIASKNNPGDALAVFADRKEMILRRDDFAAIEIGWGDKASALRRIAKHLDIGLDALVFLDDSPQERLLVQTELPEVEVIPFPQDICALPDVLLSCGLFDAFHITDEDRRRGQMYAERKQRYDARADATDVTSFLESLAVVAEVLPAGHGDIPRIAQLTQRTNQFNLTTRRYSESAIASMLGNPAWLVLTLTVRDRFGDEGVVGVSLTCVEGDRAHVDSFLMSCRVLGRGLEQAFLAATLMYVSLAGATRVSSEYVPSPKNAQAKAFYASHGFREIGREAGAITYELLTTSSRPKVPHWIQLRSAANNSVAS